MAFSPWHGRPVTAVVAVDLLAAAVSTAEDSVVVSAAVALLLAVFVAALWLPNTLEAEP